MDLFDRIYLKWATRALTKYAGPPSRERWDEIVLLLLMSKDPERVVRYRRMEADGPESLGSDAYDLWEKMPDYMPNRVAPGVKTEADLQAYAGLLQGSMRELMDRRGLGDLYNRIVAEQEEIERARQAKAKQSQRSIMIMGCAGMVTILIMMIVVFTLIIIKLGS